MASGKPITGIAAELSDDFDPLRLELPSAPDELVVGYYARPLGALGLAPGPLSSAPEPAVVPPLPDFFELQTPGQKLSPLAAGIIPETWTNFRVPAPDLLGCFGADACLVDGACTSPCPPPTPINPAAAVALPSFMPCPSGWTEANTSFHFQGVAQEVIACDSLSAGCSGDALPFVGEGCQALDDCAHPPVIQPGPGVRFVAPGGSGDGSTPGAPLGTIAAAIAAGASTIALGLGDLALPSRFDRDVRLIGICAANTRLIGGGSAEINARVFAAHLEVASALSVRAGANLALARVRLGQALSSAGQLVIDHALITGRLDIQAGSAKLSGVVFRDNAQGAVAGGAGSTINIERTRLLRGIGPGIEAHGDLSARELVVEEVDGVGLRMAGGALELDQAVFRGRSAIGDPGLGLELIGANSSLHHLYVETVNAYGIRVDRGQVTGADLVLKDARTAAAPTTNAVIGASDAALALGRVLIFGRSAGLVLDGSAGTATVTDYAAIAADSGSRQDGLAFHAQGHLLAQRLELVLQGSALAVTSSGRAHARFEDVRCDAVHMCLYLQGDAGTTVEIERMESLNTAQATIHELAGTNQAGVGAGAKLQVRDLVARATVGDQGRSAPHLLDVDSSVALDVQRFSLSGAFGPAIILPWPSQHHYADGAVSGSVVGVSIQVAVGASPPADYSGILERVKAAGNDTRFELLR